MKLILKPLIDALAVINKITAADTISLKSVKGKLKINGENLGRSLTVTIPYEDKSTWECCISKSVLDQTFKGRKELDIAIESNGHIKFSSLSFTASFATEPYNKEPELHQAEAVEISVAQQEMLNTGLAVVALVPVYESDTVFCVDISKSTSLIACFDQLHFALLEGPGLPGTLNFAFPTKTLGIVAAASKNSTYKMSTTSAAICAWNKDWQLILPFIQNDVTHTINDVKTLAHSFGSSYVRCSASKLMSVIEVASAAIEVGGAIRIQTKGDVLHISASSSIGTVTESLQCKRLVKKETDINIDPSILLSLLANVPCEFIELGVHGNKFFFIRAEDEQNKIIYGGMLSEN